MINKNYYNNLLKCPFCGNNPEIFKRGSGFDIRCNTKECYLEDGADWYLRDWEVIEKWNNRIK